MHAAGFAEIARQPDEPIGTIKLELWARLSGQLLRNGKPVPNQSVYFTAILDGQLGEPRFQDSYSVPTDFDGRFEFDHLPPIAGAVRAHLGPWQDSPLTSSQSVPLDLKPGEHKRVTLGGESSTVTGQVVATGRDDATLNKNWSLNYLISRDRGIELPSEFSNLSFDPRRPVETSWFLDPNIHRWLNTRENHFIKLAPDGRFRIWGVPPGTYDLVLRLYEQPAGCLVETVGEKVVTINVAKGDVASGSKDVGRIQVECRSGPRVGEFMGLYKFTDATGRMRSIQDMKGRHVLLHVWASWCEPCLESLPDIQATVARLEARPVTFVGLNVDKNASAAKELSRKRGWNWSQNYLGDSSDMARQLAISSVPTYFLVGPDGTLVASAVDWLEMKEKLEASIAGASN
jgi:thiol-disulfide isomerase/thioredoxin